MPWWVLFLVAHLPFPRPQIVLLTFFHPLQNFCLERKSILAWLILNGRYKKVHIYKKLTEERKVTKRRELLTTKIQHRVSPKIGVVNKVTFYGTPCIYKARSTAVILSMTILWQNKDIQEAKTNAGIREMLRKHGHLDAARRQNIHGKKFVFRSFLIFKANCLLCLNDRLKGTCLQMIFFYSYQMILSCFSSFISNPLGSDTIPNKQGKNTPNKK